AWRRLIHPDDEAVFAAAFMRAFEARDRFEALSRVVHPTLGLRWLRTEGVPRFNASGGFQGYVGATIDVTDAKKAEDDLNASTNCWRNASARPWPKRPRRRRT